MLRMGIAEQAVGEKLAISGGLRGRVQPARREIEIGDAQPVEPRELARAEIFEERRVELFDLAQHPRLRALAIRLAVS